MADRGDNERFALTPPELNGARQKDFYYPLSDDNTSVGYLKKLRRNIRKENLIFLESLETIEDRVNLQGVNPQEVCLLFTVGRPGDQEIFLSSRSQHTIWLMLNFGSIKYRRNSIYTILQTLTNVFGWPVPPFQASWHRM